MNNDGSKLRDAMGRHLDELQPATPIEQIRRRAHRGRLLMATSLVALVALVGVSGVFMLERFADDEVDRVVGPAPSPDEGLIAFATQGPKDPSPWIATVPASGGEVTRLHEGRDPSWSPDGTRIAFGCNRGICTMKADGSEVSQLTDPAAPAYDEEPDWGPGGFIAFTRSYLEGSRTRDILMVRQEGGRPTPVIEEEANFAPSWSPDGRAIAFVRGIGPRLEAPEGGFQLWRMNADGSGLVQLTEDGAARADWSPDGQTILFDRGSALWTIPAGGGQPKKLPVVSGRAFDVGDFAAWAPDSRRIAFTCSSKGRDGNDICLSDVDSEQWTALVATDENEASPAWQPVATVDANAALESEFRFEPYPGSPWYAPDGETVSPESGIINVIRGIQHCGWESAAMLHLSWPIGTPHQEDPKTHQYLRDPNGVFPADALLSRFDGNTTLARGAEYTGYRTEFMELWLTPGDDTGAFLMFTDHVEWWPRAEEPLACD